MRALGAIILLIVGCAHAPAPEQVVHTTTVAEAYRDIELAGAFAVELEIGPEAAIELSGDQEAVDHVRIEVDGERLAISMPQHRRGDGDLRVKITTPALERVEVNGAAELTMTGLEAGALDVEVNGAASTTARGTVDALDLEINGAGSFEAEKLVADLVMVEINGAGSATVHATEELHAELQGVGTVRYAGRPGTVNQDVRGMGSIRPL